ncbi:MAG: PPOX class F420-dependent oxidoreductase [Dehalococcoidia bacterium]
MEPPDNVKTFLKDNYNGVLATFRKNGAAQMSIITCGLYGGGIAFTTQEGLAKLLNLRRNPRCTLLVSRPDWWGYVVLEGYAELLSPGKTDAEELRIALRDVYRIASGTEHPDWDEYDQAMVEQQRSVIIVVPEHIYGTIG